MTPPSEHTADQTVSEGLTTLHEGRWVRLVRRGKWEFAQRSRGSHATVIVAVTDAGEIVLIEQWRASVDRPVIELPAGLVGDEDQGEEGRHAAARELEEETGFSCDFIERVAVGTASAGITDEQLEVHVARSLTKTGPGGGVAGEDILVHTVPLADCPRWLAAQQSQGKIIDLKVWTGLYFAAMASASPLPPAVEK